MIVVSDTTPIIALMKAGQLRLLQKLFDVVYIPNAVYCELTENKKYAEEARMIQKSEFVEECIVRLRESEIRIGEKLYQKLKEHVL